MLVYVYAYLNRLVDDIEVALLGPVVFDLAVVIIGQDGWLVRKRFSQFPSLRNRTALAHYTEHLV
jgi:hypothetical protein